MGYWAFTITDGALRMLVLLHFHELGYSPVALAFLFSLYELFGVFTNLVGGWIGARTGLNRTLIAGLSLQVTALMLLSFQGQDWAEWATIAWVIGAQGLSGIAKDLTKMSSKSAVKFVAGAGSLFRWVAILTGSKNALKGVGFFVGAALLGALGFDRSLWLMAAVLAVVLVTVVVLLNEGIGQASTSPPLRSVLAKSRSINVLSAARFFLFGARDIWFAVALPVFLDEVLGWSFEGIGAFMAAWVIGYGIVQSVAPGVLRGRTADNRPATALAGALAAITAVIAVGVLADWSPAPTVVGGLVIFGLVFALNSALHSYLILAYSQSDDDVAMDVGFYYSANAAGRLVGTLLSGVLYLVGDFELAMAGATAFAVAAAVLSHRLPRAIGSPELQPV